MALQLISAFIISLLHGFIPSHWLPLLSLSKNFNWSRKKTFLISSLASFSHALGTVIIGIVVAFGSRYFEGFLTQSNVVSKEIIERLGGVLLIFLGIWFYYRHHKHHHFHLELKEKSRNKLILVVVFSMFLSPCMEIIGYFSTLSEMKIQYILILIAGYILTTWISIVAGVFIGKKGIQKIDSHKWEHNSGIITSSVLVISGILTLVF